MSFYVLGTGAVGNAETQGADCVFRMVLQHLPCSPLGGRMGLEVTLIRILPRNQGWGGKARTYWAG